MKVTVLACAITALSFAVHWCLWRIWVPRRQTLALMMIFFGVLIGGCLVGSCRDVRDHGWGLEWPWDYVQVAMFHISMTLGYVVAYSAIENRSPSMKILTFVADGGEEGRSRREVQELLGQDSPLEVRIEAMLRDGMVKRTDGGLTLTGKGDRWATAFSQWANLIGLGKGG